MFLTTQNARTILVILKIVVIDFIPSAGVFSMVDNVIDCGINPYSVDSAISFLNIYPLDSDLSSGQRYPTFEQREPADVCNSTDRRNSTVTSETNNFIHLNVSTAPITTLQTCGLTTFIATHF